MFFHSFPYSHAGVSVLQEFEEGFAAFLTVDLNGYGHRVVRAAHVTDAGYELGAWMQAQRRARKMGTLSNYQTRRLDGSGFVWGWKAADVWRRQFYLARVDKRISPGNKRTRESRAHFLALLKKSAVFCKSLNVFAKPTGGIALMGHRQHRPPTHPPCPHPHPHPLREPLQTHGRSARRAGEGTGGAPAAHCAQRQL